MASYHLVIVSNEDTPIFTEEFGALAKKSGEKRDGDRRYLNEFIIHAALDMVDAQVWKQSAMYLKVIDRFNEWYVSAFTTASRIKFMLLHDAKNDDGIKNFFNELHELYIKALLNPFYNPGESITTKDFRAKVRQAGKRNL
mmetsp:Transcript_18339/g.47918  ORF Transcript_18339/g.47918 Transcript_18339/m.47918 type:complete len:141 (-) Transcript_18339:430-852(-)|eukprot:CAMPEP_0182950212 /NCGR_PEP_ID=MMETSP0105_2-20130417/60651_1 /TAXON_ID=81532 ORGANISM="Acanthoeca-like sp., Strain 10tr" /NCGR_SAMPLE_ID=MMETSP0105_2 /ASSEMBLY_ACC=CAM_ASM_000205 /LENGTH=140 /DNA_ID=CAMNT_0025090513 /DNA_START=240 /DNA_END=662 /DNA_ORIENTATION=+